MRKKSFEPEYKLATKQWLLIVNSCFVIKNCFAYTVVFHFEKGTGFWSLENGRKL